MPPRPSRKERKKQLQFQIVRDENGEVALRCLNPPKGVKTREQLRPYLSPNIPIEMIEETKKQSKFSRENFEEDDEDAALAERLLRNMKLEDLDFGDDLGDDFDAYDNFDDDIDVIDMADLEATEGDSAHKRNAKLLTSGYTDPDSYAYDYNKHFKPFSEHGAFFVPGQGVVTDPTANDPIVPAAPDVDETYLEDLKTDATLEERSKKIEAKAKGKMISAASGLELPIFESSKFKFTEDFLAPFETGETEGYEEIEDNIFELLLGLDGDDESEGRDDPSNQPKMTREEILRQLQSPDESSEPVEIFKVSSTSANANPANPEQGPKLPKGKGGNKKGVKFAETVTTSTNAVEHRPNKVQATPAKKKVLGSAIGAWSDEENNDDEADPDDMFGYDDDNLDDDMFGYDDDDDDDDDDAAYDEDEDYYDDDYYDDEDEGEEELDEEARVDREIIARMKQRIMKNFKPEDGVTVEIEEHEDEYEDEYDIEGEGEFDDLSWYFNNQHEGEDMEYDDDEGNIYEHNQLENDPYYEGQMLVQFNKLMDEYEYDNSTDDDEFERPYDSDDDELQFHVNKDGLSLNDQDVRAAINEFSQRKAKQQMLYRQMPTTMQPEALEFTKNWINEQQHTPQASLTQVEKEIDRQFAKKKKDRIDIQSTRTTLSTTANIPTLIKEVRIKSPAKSPSKSPAKAKNQKNQKNQQQQQQQQGPNLPTSTTESTRKAGIMDPDYVPTTIKLDAMGVPVGIMNKHRQERQDKGPARAAENNMTANTLVADSMNDNDQDEDDDEDDELDVNEYVPGAARTKSETPEERKARKAALKAHKRNRREEKKQTKEMYKQEQRKQKNLEYQIKHHNPAFKKIL